MRLLGVAAFAVVLALGLSKAEQDPEDKVDRGCMWQLCNATGDMGYCSACIQKLVDEGTLPGMEIFSCLNDKGECLGFQPDDLEDLRKCMAGASKRLGECIAIPNPDTKN
ncbi:uncharacterized protein [Penaeus vannamei]|uniref:uncharacterized protein n=1 Tax=Penaeus vannamei TaxID=6689 RepID=UPI00387FAED5